LSVKRGTTLDAVWRDSSDTLCDRAEPGAANRWTFGVARSEQELESVAARMAHLGANSAQRVAFERMAVGIGESTALVMAVFDSLLPWVGVRCRGRTEASIRGLISELPRNASWLSALGPGIDGAELEL
jgi:hypothetical protein